MNQLSPQQFLELTRRGNLIPVYKEILADLETPVSAYLKFARTAKYSFLLESVEGQEKIGRYSFLAKAPELVFRSKGRRAEIIRFKSGKPVKRSLAIEDSPLSIIREIMADFRFVNIPQLPRFCGGMVGYLSYDCVRFFEKLPDRTVDDLKVPDAVMVLAKDLVVFDHLHHKIQVVSCVETAPGDNEKALFKKYDRALKKIDAMIKELNAPLRTSARTAKDKVLTVKSNCTQAKFEDMVEKAKKEIAAGEIIQVVPSQRFEVPIATDPFNIYRALRVVNPSPYMFYLRFDDLMVVGSSPELLVRCEDGLVETRPIAGTRPRGKDETEDEALARELLADPKEKAEHVMLVDLGRNDLGRVCQKGTVKLSEFMIVEKYSHVMHIVSNVQGRLREDKDALDVLAAAFPAGTVSGAPKIRAMEIIEDLEGVRRGVYAGCVGYFSFSKNLDTCITIRTILVRHNKAYVQAGCGVVADSNPRSEYVETVNKAKAQIRAIELAHQSLS